MEPEKEVTDSDVFVLILGDGNPVVEVPHEPEVGGFLRLEYEHDFLHIAVTGKLDGRTYEGHVYKYEPKTGKTQ